MTMKKLKRKWKRRLKRRHVRSADSRKKMMMMKMRRKKRMKGQAYPRKRQHVHNADLRKRKMMMERRNVTKKLRKKRMEGQAHSRKMHHVQKLDAKEPLIARGEIAMTIMVQIFRSGRAVQPKNPYFAAKIREKRINQLFVPIDVVRLQT
ncbi:uncharacterized protein LOC132599110 [Lycium barbarum]|uniref:uncharacterized protein LOC132599110 n=1 Tax=Lycium barbarum TaxID=112863 RepID=UPI00293F6995|nr:uncharacterized protein LOC132599110 [Lycium barbarum]